MGSLADEYPGLADQWDNERNGVPASEAVVLTSEKYWWVCPQGHSWRQYLFNRRAGGPGCPVCSGRLIVAGVNDLATTHPDVAAQWHPDLNGDLLPTQFTLGSRKDAWWLCPEGHAWRAQIRTWRGGRTGYAGCTVCRDEARVTAAREQELAAAANRLARARVPSATPIPSALAAQWHPTKNTVDWPGGITTVSRSSRRSAHWLCDCGHDWYGPVLRRIRVGALGVCPKCGEHWNR